MELQKILKQEIHVASAIGLSFPATGVTVLAMPPCKERQVMQKGHYLLKRSKFQTASHQQPGFSIKFEVGGL